MPHNAWTAWPDGLSTKAIAASSVFSFHLATAGELHHEHGNDISYLDFLFTLIQNTRDNLFRERTFYSGTLVTLCAFFCHGLLQQPSPLLISRLRDLFVRNVLFVISFRVHMQRFGDIVTKRMLFAGHRVPLMLQMCMRLNC